MVLMVTSSAVFSPSNVRPFCAVFLCLHLAAFFTTLSWNVTNVSMDGIADRGRDGWRESIRLERQLKEWNEVGGLVREGTGLLVSLLI